MTGPGDQPAPLHQFWWLHDARWYQGVAKRFGQEAANEINAEAIRFVARRVAVWCSGGVRPDVEPPAKLFGLLRRITSTMFPDDMVSARYRDCGDGAWETEVTNHFVPRMLRAARSLDGYRCVCLPLRSAWYEGLQLAVRDDRLACQIEGAPACRFRTVCGRDTDGRRCDDERETA